MDNLCPQGSFAGYRIRQQLLYCCEVDHLSRFEGILGDFSVCRVRVRVSDKNSRQLCLDPSEFCNYKYLDALVSAKEAQSEKGLLQGFTLS
jgi:hypothetical protein